MFQEGAYLPNLMTIPSLMDLSEDDRCPSAVCMRVGKLL